jgi:hypothetical protein
MELTKLFLILYAVIILIKLIKAGIRKVYNPGLTEAAMTEYINSCVKTRSYADFKTASEELIEFEGHLLFAHFIPHEVPGVNGGVLVEFDIHPNAGNRFSISRSTFLFIRSDPHIEWMREKLALFEAARAEFLKSVSGGFSLHEERAILSKIAEIHGRTLGDEDLETAIT